MGEKILVVGLWTRKMNFMRLGRVTLGYVWITTQVHTWAHGVDGNSISKV